MRTNISKFWNVALASGWVVLALSMSPLGCSSDDGGGDSDPVGGAASDSDGGGGYQDVGAGGNENEGGKPGVSPLPGGACPCAEGLTCCGTAGANKEPGVCVLLGPGEACLN